MSMKRIGSLLLLLVSPVRAMAQDASVVEIRSAFGASTYLHADLDYTAPVALVSVGGGPRPVPCEPEFAYAWQEQHAVFASVQQTTRDTFQSIGFNVVRRWPG